MQCSKSITSILAIYPRKTCQCKFSAKMACFVIETEYMTIFNVSFCHETQIYIKWLEDQSVLGDF